MARIAILDDYQNLAKTLADWSPLEPDHEVVVFNKRLAGEEAVTEALLPFDVVCLMRERTPFGGSQIARLPNLKLIVTAGMYNAAIDVAAANARGIVVSGAPPKSHATSELTLGLMLALARNVATEAANMRSGGWQSTLGTELSGKTLGIVGLGKLGSRVAGYGRALGMDVIAWSQNLTGERAAEGGARRVEKAELFSQSDFVTIHLKLSERTRGLISEAELELMKPTAFLINTSRGPIVKESALLAALREDKIAGAGLDVFDEEPLPVDHPLRLEPRALLTPHLGYWTKDNLTIWYRGMVDSVAAWASGSPVRVIEA